MPSRSAPEPPPRDDALHAISTIGAWVANADAKIGLLAAGLTVLAGGVVRQRRQVETLLKADLHPRAVIALVVLTASVLTLAAAAYFLDRALRPRLTNDQQSRFSFPYLADADINSLMISDATQVRREGWVQAKTLATIARAKYRCFSKALSFSLFSGVAFLTWLLLVPTS
jgi:hypothetical protein